MSLHVSICLWVVFLSQVDFVCLVWFLFTTIIMCFIACFLIILFNLFTFPLILWLLLLADFHLYIYSFFFILHVPIFYLMYCVEIVFLSHHHLFHCRKTVLFNEYIAWTIIWPISSCSFSFITKQDTCIFSVQKCVHGDCSCSCRVLLLLYHRMAVLTISQASCQSFLMRSGSSMCLWWTTFPCPSSPSPFGNLDHLILSQGYYS